MKTTFVLSINSKKTHCNDSFLYIFHFFRENMAKGGGICVANHTTPIDVLILMCDRCYSLVRSCTTICQHKGYKNVIGTLSHGDGDARDDAS